MPLSGWTPAPPCQASNSSHLRGLDNTWDRQGGFQQVCRDRGISDGTGTARGGSQLPHLLSYCPGDSDLRLPLRVTVTEVRSSSASFSLQTGRAGFPTVGQEACGKCCCPPPVSHGVLDAARGPESSLCSGVGSDSPCRAHSLTQRQASCRHRWTWIGWRNECTIEQVPRKE